MIDLHCHSYFSDGLHSPDALIHRAIQAKLNVLALTDHDTIAGLAELRLAARQSGINTIDGIELSACWKKHDIHILGLRINPEDHILLNIIERQSECRTNRALQIGLNLERFGIIDAYRKACDVAGHERVGRPHFAKVLMDEGVTPDLQSGFKRYLNRGRPVYVTSNWLNLDEIVSGIVKAGGQAVIAHPLKYKLTRMKLRELVVAFKQAGGVGIEVVSGDTIPSQIEELAQLSLRFELLASSGSDFHGDTVSRVALGRQQSLPLYCKPIWHDWF